MQMRGDRKKRINVTVLGPIFEAEETWGHTKRGKEIITDHPRKAQMQMACDTK